jgi:hypothetical protein
MDEYIEAHSENKPKDSATSPNANVSAAPTRSNTKRVHFSTKNSMVQIKPLPRHHNHHSMSSDMHDDVLNSTYENQSQYSNEYELIGSSRTYVDMDTKSLSSDCGSSNTFKPKLPPKPDNLMKLQQIAKQRQFVQDQLFIECNKKNSEYEMNESEPDYASISEIQDSIKSIKVVTAEIHNDADNLLDDDNEYSEIKEVPTPTQQTSPTPPTSITTQSNHMNEDDSFADVPKLPNVYSIIPGIETNSTSSSTPTSPVKKSSTNNDSTNKCIGHDNYITKSPMKKKIPIAFASVQKQSKDNDKAGSELNSSKKTTKPSPPPLPMKQTIKIIDDKIQQEFDWYNLDAEYTKTDIVITPQIENIDEMYHFDDENNVNDVDDEAIVKVEYNLEDFEYETAPSEGSGGINDGIEIETNNNNFTTVIKINNNESSSITSTSSSTSTCSTSSDNNNPLPASPVNNSKKITTTANLMELAETPKIDFKKNAKNRYEKFLKESGLISKPLLSSKKKFYAGSFV